MSRRHGADFDAQVAREMQNNNQNAQKNIKPNSKMSKDKPLKAQKPKKKKKRIFLKLFLVFLMLVALLGLGVARFVNSNLEELSSMIYKPIETSRTVDLQKEEPVSILLLGVDEREGDKGRSDAMILLTINPEEESTKMVSIPRDTLVEIPGHGEDKINHAYAYGSEQLAVDTVEDFLEVPVDYYVKMNFDGFVAFIDAIGGVTVEVMYDCEYNGVALEAGVQHLNGEEALTYCRARKDTPEGDFSRQQAQQQVISAAIDQLLSIDTLKNIDEIIAALGDNMTTNLTSKEMWYLVTGYMKALTNVENIQMETEGDSVNGMSVQIYPEEDRAALSEELNAHLGL